MTEPDLGVLLALAYQEFVRELHEDLAERGFDDLAPIGRLRLPRPRRRDPVDHERARGPPRASPSRGQVSWSRT